MERFLAIWFRQLTTDWLLLHQPRLEKIPFAYIVTEQNRKIVQAPNILSKSLGVHKGMLLADARIVCPGLEVMDAQSNFEHRLLRVIGLWCIQFSPRVAIDGDNGLLIDLTGCAHLWGGERDYFKTVVYSLQQRGYDVRCAIADTGAAAWAWARFGKTNPIIAPGAQRTALLTLPAAALRLDGYMLKRLKQFGLNTVNLITAQPMASLTPRFGKELIERMNYCFGDTVEPFIPLCEPQVFREQLACLEPVTTRKGIEVALEQLLETLCQRLAKEGKGLRTAVFSCYRIDGDLQEQRVGCNRATSKAGHLFHLFQEKIGAFEPALGFELFSLEAPHVEAAPPQQEILFSRSGNIDTPEFAELLDRMLNKDGVIKATRYLPAEHHWPERSVRPAKAITEEAGEWRITKTRPFSLLPSPERIEVIVPIPDYPPKVFTYRGKTHKVVRADGPERIENEWWLENRLLRDYYVVEDEHGARYWLFRAGHYGEENPVAWFIHGFFG